MPMTRPEAERQLTAPGAMFEVDHLEIRGVPTRVWKNAPPTLVDILRSSRGYGDRPFIVYEDERLSFEEHFQAVARLAHALRDRFGVRTGDRVAIAMRNYPEWSVAFWAAAAAGAVIVPLNAWWTGEELAYGLADSGTKVVVVDGERQERLAAEWARLPALETVIVARPGGAEPSDALDGRRVSYEDALGSDSAPGARADPRPSSTCPPSTSAPRTTPPSSIPRARRAGPRARSAPTATSAPTP